MESNMLPKWLVQTVIWLGVLATILFVSAGTVNWPGAWIFLIESLGVSLVLGFWLARYDPALQAERLRLPIQKGQSTPDKIISGLLLLFFFAWFVLIGLDAVRFKWSAVPSWLAPPGALGVLLACYIAYLVFRENSFAATTVKIQRERAQTVVTTGPYRYVRHPMYAGMIFYLLGVPLLLGSWWGLLGGLALLALFAIRILIEEQTLKAELQGYREYTDRVRYRLIPWVW